MKRILVDTNAYAAFKRNESSAVGVLQRAEFIGINTVVLGELLCGFKGGRQEGKNLEELTLFLESPRVNVIPVDEETSEFYARIYWDLRKKCHPIPTNDIWVAASAMRGGLALFSYDEHFNHIAGLILQRLAF